jgi:hypothetical protein
VSAFILLTCVPREWRLARRFRRPTADRPIGHSENMPAAAVEANNDTQRDSYPSIRPAATWRKGIRADGCMNRRNLEVSTRFRPSHLSCRTIRPKYNTVQLGAWAV